MTFLEVGTLKSLSVLQHHIKLDLHMTSGELGTCLGISHALTVSMRFGYGLAILSSYSSVVAASGDDYILPFALSMTGAGVGMMLLPALTQSLLFMYGWRGTMLLLGAFNLHSVVAAATLSSEILSSERQTYEPIRETDELPVKEELHGIKSDQKNTVEIDGWVRKTRRAACKHLRGLFDFARLEIESYGIRVTPQLCFVILAVIPFGMTYNGWAIFVIPNAELKGYLNGDAVVVSVTAGVGNIIGRILCGLLPKVNPHIFKPSILFLILNAVNGVALIVNSATSNFALLISLAGISGLAIGAGVVLKSLLIIEVICIERDCNSSITCSLLAQGIGEACGGTLSGYLFTITTSTESVFLMLGCCAFASSALVLLALVHSAITKASCCRTKSHY
ncbi:monocarboxylate transporter 12-like [Diadema antillarum]|uniref:monocarboxylate transporter 12-like n=1 Tax=Diadema antillarum TaxID=105358 RepID=UPI003A8C5BF8